MSISPPNLTGPKLHKISCKSYTDGTWSVKEDLLTPESLIKLYWNQEHRANLLCSPHDLETLCLGHALLEYCAQSERPIVQEKQDSNYFLASTNRAQDLPLESNCRLNAEEVFAAMQALTSAKGSWEQTGCFHRAGIYAPEKKTFLFAAEDIGRHNCLDRLAGWALNNSVNLRATALFVSARATASLLQKALKAGFPLLVSRSATTSKALELAEKNDMTLLGFVREKRFTLFTDTQNRIASY